MNTTAHFGNALRPLGDVLPFVGSTAMFTPKLLTTAMALADKSEKSVACIWLNKEGLEDLELWVSPLFDPIGSQHKLEAGLIGYLACIPILSSAHLSYVPTIYIPQFRFALYTKDQLNGH